MSAETALATVSWRVGRWTCTATIPTPKSGQVAHLAVEWSPQLPKRLTPAEMAEYRAGRNRALAEVSKKLGGAIAVVDL